MRKPYIPKALSTWSPDDRMAWEERAAILEYDEGPATGSGRRISLLADPQNQGEIEVKHYAEELSDVMMRMEDLRAEAAAILDAAKDAGVNTRALRKVAKELITDAGKLAKLYDDEDQLDMFRAEVGIKKRKGLELEAAE